ncbi:MAG: M48 family metallopeptidase [Paludibacteraceae bacterium]|nr:DUF45 domain-containing protein [Candidatus Physcocola equi]MCQ2235166.1 M48 family metallopeptidase [Paludibacteraceae bacterium]
MDKGIQIIVTYRRTSRLSMRVSKQGEIHISAPYGLAKEEVERFYLSNQAWIAKALSQQNAHNERRQQFYNQLSLKTKKEKEEAIARLKACTDPLIEKYANAMGVHPYTIEYKPTISRWGACQKQTKRIQFSLYLLLLPAWCIEHVVVHELAHLKEANHSPKFYAIMDQFFPKWKEARLETKRIIEEYTPNT